MRFLAVTVCLLTVNVIDCSSQLRPEDLNGPKQRNEEPPNTAFFLGYNDTNHGVPEQGYNLDSIEEKAGKPLCSSVCGTCISRRNTVKECCEKGGKVDKAFRCRSRGEVCCIKGCPKTKGFFSPTGSQQCFKLFNSTTYNWTQANAACISSGLVLAHPHDGIAARSYIIQRFGSLSYAWLGARGDEYGIYWDNNLEEITVGNPLWYPGQPWTNVSSNCLVLLAGTVPESYNFWANEPERPYWANGCDYYGYGLCELVLS